MPKYGQPILLNVQLDDGATDKFVRATLRDADGNTLPESPVQLSHVANGLYTDESVSMPDTQQVTAQYEVFLDSGFTQPANYPLGLDTFPLEETPLVGPTDLTPVLEKLDSIKADTTALLAQGYPLP